MTVFLFCILFPTIDYCLFFHKVNFNKQQPPMKVSINEYRYYYSMCVSISVLFRTKNSANPNETKRGKVFIVEYKLMRINIETGATGTTKNQSISTKLSPSICFDTKLYFCPPKIACFIRKNHFSIAIENK